MTIMPIPVAARALVLSWALTAASALNAMPVAAQPSPKASEPPPGSPAAARAPPLSSPRIRLAPKLITRAALSGALRPRRPPLSSSSCPLSSSARVCRMVTNTIRTATAAVMNAVYLIMDREPNDVGSYTRPNRATMAAAAFRVLAASMRLALSGNRPAPAEAVDQDIIANARIHSDSSQRSRRSPSRTRSPVPASVSRSVGPSAAGGDRTGRHLTGRRCVVPQEQVFQGRGLAGQGLQAGGGQRLHERGETRRFHLGADPVIRHDQVVDAGQGLQAWRHRCDVGDDRGPGQVPHLLERAGLHHLAGSDDADPVGQGLGLAEDVAAQQDGPSLVAQLTSTSAEGVLHQRVKATGGLVEQEHLGIGSKGSDEGHLLTVALGVGAGLLGRVQVEHLQQTVSAGLVLPAL